MRNFLPEKGLKFTVLKMEILVFSKTSSEGLQRRAFTLLDGGEFIFLEGGVEVLWSLFLLLFSLLLLLFIL
jgi:hypothetical protein